VRIKSDLMNRLREFDVTSMTFSWLPLEAVVRRQITNVNAFSIDYIAPSPGLPFVIGLSGHGPGSGAPRTAGQGGISSQLFIFALAESLNNTLRAPRLKAASCHAKTG
jgi:hypothetical protein